MPEDTRGDFSPAVLLLGMTSLVLFAICATIIAHEHLLEGRIPIGGSTECCVL